MEKILLILSILFTIALMAWLVDSPPIQPRDNFVPVEKVNLAPAYETNSKG